MWTILFQVQVFVFSLSIGLLGSTGASASCQITPVLSLATRQAHSACGSSSLDLGILLNPIQTYACMNESFASLFLLTLCYCSIIIAKKIYNLLKFLVPYLPGIFSYYCSINNQRWRYLLWDKFKKKVSLFDCLCQSVEKVFVILWCL